jgi:hypothetical protein
MTEIQLRRIIARLAKRLEPFAREADTWSDDISRAYRPGVTEPRSRYSHAKAEFSIGDLRNARSELRRFNIVYRRPPK